MEEEEEEEEEDDEEPGPSAQREDVVHDKSSDTDENINVIIAVMPKAFNKTSKFLLKNECLKIRQTYISEWKDTEDNTGIKAEMKIDVMEEICEVIFERRSEVTGYSYFQETENIDSLQNCIALCRMSNDPACSAVDFSIDKGECTLLTVNPNAHPYPRKRNGETEDLPLYSDLNEEIGYDVSGPSSNQDEMNENDESEIQLEILQEICKVHFTKGTVISNYSFFQETETVDSLPSCLTSCRLTDSPSVCAAVEYNPFNGQCQLFAFNLKAEKHTKNQESEFAIIESCESYITVKNIVPAPFLFRDDPVTSSSDESSARNNEGEEEGEEEEEEEEETVRTGTLLLYNLLQRCDVRYHNKRNITGFKKRWEKENVRHLTACVTCCRIELQCSAVMFSSRDRVCGFYSISEDEEVVQKNSENAFVEILDCRLDRLHERYRNPPFMKYFLPTVEELCTIEFYTLAALTCRVTASSEHCSAVNFLLNGECILLQKATPDDTDYKYWLHLKKHKRINFDIYFSLQYQVTMNTAFKITLKLFLFNLAVAEQFMIYVRPLEKLCTVEKKLIETSLITESLIEQWSLASLEMCISACFMRRAGIPCESVVFDSQQDHNCKLLDNSFLQTSSAHHGSSPQSDLYVIHSCDRDYSNYYGIIQIYSKIDQNKELLLIRLHNNRIGEQAAVADDQQTIQSLDENLVISTQMQLEITQESCTLFFLRERTAAGFSYFHQDFAHTLNNCLALCRMTFEPSECIAVDYNSDNNQCVLLTLNPDASPYARQHGIENDAAAIENASQNDVQTDEVEFQQIGDNTGVEARMNLNVLQESCLVYFLREASVTGYSFFNQETSIDSLENCITLCRLADAQHACTAVHFTADSKECTLLRVNPNADPYTRQLQSEFVVIGDCEPIQKLFAHLANDAAALLPTEENENINNVNENLSLIKSTVAIYQMLEECNGNYYKSAVIPGFHDVQKIRHINSFPQCLHHCRVEALTETCDAVLFSKEEKKCTLFERDDNLAANKTAEEIFIELTDCHDDRSEERKYNPAPMKYYFSEEKEICLIEFYVQRTISSWSQINELQNVTSMRTCMEECRSKQQSQSEKCAAFNINSDKKCRLFKKDSTAPLYTVMEGGIFGEILLCFPVINDIPLRFALSHKDLQLLAFSEKVLIYLNATDSLCVVERKALNLEQIFHNLTQALPFYLMESNSLQDCIALCCKEENCKSVVYSNREGHCLLLQNSFDNHQSKLFRLKNRPQLYTVHTCNQKCQLFNCLGASAIPDVMRTVQEEELFLLPSYDYLPSSSEDEAMNISEYSSEASEILNEDVQRNETYYVAQLDNESEESTDDSDQLQLSIIKMLPDQRTVECSLAIYQLLEECHINFLLKGEVVVGYKVILQHSNVEHLQLCAYYCRIIWDEDRCAAISFLISERKCTLYKNTNDGRAKINLKKNEKFIEIIACHDGKCKLVNRSGERLENAPPLRYYFPKTQDICIVEFYKLRILSSWQKLAERTNVSSLQECMENCRAMETSHGCSAINFSITRLCFLFIKDYDASMYTTLPEKEPLQIF
ncbi:hypothetical protein T10_2812 [Trichinella papuae]|uniref:Apple domain-containing protein n=1 Tax=Trichinella papuae TaxID=268474 RepID=A0A0V1N5S4_9BILA|nr:hypothetical protein T10_2812 [Trichinella papuae]